MTKLITPRTTRDTSWPVGQLPCSPAWARSGRPSAQAPKASGPDYAVFTEFSPSRSSERRLEHARLHGHRFTQRQCDPVRFRHRHRDVAPGTYHISGNVHRQLQQRRRASRNGHGARSPPPQAIAGRACGLDSGQPRRHQITKILASNASQRGHANMIRAFRNLFNDDRPGDENASGASSGKQSPKQV